MKWYLMVLPLVYCMSPSMRKERRLGDYESVIHDVMNWRSFDKDRDIARATGLQIMSQYGHSWYLFDAAVKSRLINIEDDVDEYCKKIQEKGANYIPFFKEMIRRLRDARPMNAAYRYEDLSNEK